MRPAIASSVLKSRTARLLAAVAAIAGLAAAGAALADGQSAADLLKVRVGGDAHQARVVVELDRTASGRLASPDAPGAKIIVALPHVEVAGDMAGAGEGLVKAWTVDTVGGAARLKLELTHAASVKRRFLLPPGDGMSVYRYVVDVDDGATPKPAPTSASAAAAPVKATPAEAGEGADVGLVSAALVHAKKVVVVDAGHGGRDSGALGSSSKEKDDTLAAARALRDRLERTGRYKVVMTRDTDAYIPLETRVQIARRANADLFISLHADSMGVVGASTRGASVYTLSDRGADRTAKGVFERSDWFMNVDLPGQDSATKRILLDLTQRQNVNRSSTFAEILLDRLSGVTDLLHRSHRDANLMVLLAPDVPAVLLEMGFITNPEDERAMANSEHRARVVDAVADAIDLYFADEARYALR